MQEQVPQYYNQLASTYDEARFHNSYGRFVHAEEEDLLRKYLTGERVVNLACGTGRFMQYCELGLDISPAMLEVAAGKYPAKRFRQANALAIDWKGETYGAAICFHLLMHLDQTDLAVFLQQARAGLAPGGLLIFDVPAKERRQLLGDRQQGWHGANSYTHAEVLALLDPDWELVEMRGVLWLPIHRFPRAIRPFLFKLDQLLNKSPIRHYASYRMYVLRKK